jgi:hypothetical protein
MTSGGRHFLMMLTQAPLTFWVPVGHPHSPAALGTRGGLQTIVSFTHWSLSRWVPVGHPHSPAALATRGGLQTWMIGVQAPSTDGCPCGQTHWLRPAPEIVGGGQTHSPAAFMTSGFTQTFDGSQVKTFNTTTVAEGGTVSVLTGEYVVVQWGIRRGGQTFSVGGVSETVQLVPEGILFTVCDPPLVNDIGVSAPPQFTLIW